MLSRAYEPRFVTFLGLEAPSLADLSDRRHTKTQLPLHLKPEVIATIGPQQRATLLELTTDPLLRARLEKVFMWLHSVDLYEDIVARAAGNPLRPARVALSRAELDELLQAAKLTRINDPHQDNRVARFFVNLFTVDEVAKGRRRVIGEPILNDLITKDDLIGVRLPSKQQIRRLAARRAVRQYDAACYFDQFQLASGIERFFTIRTEVEPTGDAKAEVARVLLMGFRPAVDVAQTTSEAVISFAETEHATADTATYVDNWAVGTDDEAEADAIEKKFRARCASCGIVLKEQRQHSFGDWFELLGECYNSELQLRKQTAGTVTKLRAALRLVQQKLGTMPARNVAAIFGIAFYGAKVLNTRLHRYPAALAYWRFISSVGDWDSCAPAPTMEAALQLQHWVMTLIQNQPVALIDDELEAPDVTIYVDASVWGVGAVATFSNGHVETLSCPWSAEERLSHQVQFSSVAEPLSVVKACTRFITPHVATRALIFSDHAGLVFAAASGYGKAAGYNNMLQRLDALFPSLHYSIRFVSGLSNPADPYSRGHVAPSVKVGVSSHPMSYQNKRRTALQRP
jgi:hypothetical protein